MLTAAAMLSACKHDEADPRTADPLVRVAVATLPALPTRGFTGIVSARVQSELGFRVPGKVVARLVDTGQRVTRGQALMRLDHSDLALADDASRGTVAAARARAVQTAADEQRYRGLVAAGAVSASNYDQARAAADAAAALLKAAEAQAGVVRDQAGYAVLVADADGIVVETLAEPGQVVNAGQTVVRLAHAGPREAIISLPESLRPALGSTAQATVYDGGAGAARLRQLSEAADPRTRTFEARYVLEGHAAEAPLGSTVTLRLPDPHGSTALQVPLAAIYDAGKGPGVWIVAGNAAHVSWRAVTLDGLGVETAAVAKGLREGDRFVALGAHLLHEGQAVRVATARDTAP
jgi:RND family efflux transporter MFP subunit